MVELRRERAIRELCRCVAEIVVPHRRHVMTAAALALVMCAVPLALETRLPFPPPGERILHDPSRWSLLFHASAAAPARQEMTNDPALSVGGYSTVQPPVTVMLYRARPGDTMSGIAIKLGLNIDTVSSMNRTAGRGVHNVTVGETLEIPSQDGISLALTADFDELCRKHSVLPEDVLAANSLTRGDLAPGMELFFPGVQHTGYAYQLSVGVGVALPLRGWESSPFGRRDDPFTGLPSRHSGVDIAAPEGSPIKSATDGTVVAAGYDTMLGNYVDVRAQLGMSYVYGHMSRILVSQGMRVSTGTLLGLVGYTGYATGPHLHFEVRRYGVPQNPKDYLPPRR
jgi:murein DD-endopeptidase MepM/ murein hydrolase activator NlpD